MPKILTFTTLGEAHSAPRFWIEGRRLADLGFAPGTPIDVWPVARGLTITPAPLSDRVVSSRKAAGALRPIITEIFRQLAVFLTR